MTRAQIILPLLTGGLFVAALLIAYFRAGHGSKDDPIPYQKPTFCDRAGFAVTDLPGDEIITLQRCALCYGCRVAELYFSIEPGHEAVLRLARTADSLHMEDLTGPYEANSVEYLDGIRVLVRSGSCGACLASWTKGDFHYALQFLPCEMGLAGGLLDDFVREVDAENC